MTDDERENEDDTPEVEEGAEPEAPPEDDDADASEADDADASEDDGADASEDDDADASEDDDADASEDDDADASEDDDAFEDPPEDIPLPVPTADGDPWPEGEGEANSGYDDKPEEASPAPAPEPPRAVQEVESVDVVHLLAIHRDPLEMAPFLADEFLLWLWYASERNYTTFTLSEDGETVDLWIDDRLTFQAVEEKQVSSTFKGGAPSTLPEAKLSILSGKRLGEAKIGIRRGEAEWGFVLKGKAGQLMMTGLKVPATVKEGWEEMIYERMYLIDRAAEVLEALFAQFFRIRTSPEWEAEEAPAMRMWLMGDG